MDKCPEKWCLLRVTALSKPYTYISLLDTMLFDDIIHVRVYWTRCYLMTSYMSQCIGHHVIWWHHTCQSILDTMLSDDIIHVRVYWTRCYLMTSYMSQCIGHHVIWLHHTCQSILDTTLSDDIIHVRVYWTLRYLTTHTCHSLLDTMLFDDIIHVRVYGARPHIWPLCSAGKIAVIQISWGVRPWNFQEMISEPTSFRLLKGFAKTCWESEKFRSP